VIVKEALANGRLTDRDADPVLREVAREQGSTSDAVALAAALAQPWSTVVLSGASTVPMVQSNLAARDAQADPRLDALRENPGGYWARRSAMSWT
jgi:aryl-alcohol dehydrogenase-like predicted oxidoreductase